jgi:hypothetical protein
MAVQFDRKQVEGAGVVVTCKNFKDVGQEGKMVIR